jgi:hypothetical protein
MSIDPDAGVAGGLESRCTEFVIAGDSHIFSLGAFQGYAGPPSTAPIPDVQGGHFFMEPWVKGRGPSYWDALVKHVAGRLVVLMVMGNQHFGNFLLAQKPLFDVVDPSSTDPCYPGAVVVPRRMVKALPAFDSKWLQALISRLRKSDCLDVFVAGTPPVREDYPNGFDDVRKRGYWFENAAKLGFDIAKCEFTPAPVMKRLWGVLQESLESAARASDSRFIPVPEEAIDATGYLSAQYRGPMHDFTHANNAYGHLMLRKIVKTVQESDAEIRPPPTISGA